MKSPITETEKITMQDLVGYAAGLDCLEWTLAKICPEGFNNDFVARLACKADDAQTILADFFCNGSPELAASYTRDALNGKHLALAGSITKKQLADYYNNAYRQMRAFWDDPDKYLYITIDPWQEQTAAAEGILTDLFFNGNNAAAKEYIDTCGRGIKVN